MPQLLTRFIAPEAPPRVRSPEWIRSSPETALCVVWQGFESPKMFLRFVALIPFIEDVQATGVRRIVTLARCFS